MVPMCLFRRGRGIWYETTPFLVMLALLHIYLLSSL